MRTARAIGLTASSAPHAVHQRRRCYRVQGGLAINNGYAVVDGGTYRTVGCEHDGDTAGVYSYYALYIAGEEGVVEAHINGGTYTAAYRSAVLAGNDNPGGDGGINAKATAYITGGTFNGGTAKDAKALSAGKNTGDPKITGGTFNIRCICLRGSRQHPAQP